MKMIKQNSHILSKIYIVDDHPIICDALNEWLSNEHGFRVCGTASNTIDAMKGISATKPDLVLADLSLDDSSGLDLIRQLQLDFPSIYILVFSVYDEMLYAERVIRSGAHGFVAKTEKVDNIIAAIRKVLDGEIYLSQMMSNILLRKMVKSNTSATPKTDGLTDRETEIFTLLGHGLTLQAIAKKIKRSAKTVAVHRDNIRKKLELESSSALIHYATLQTRQDGLIMRQGYK